MRRREIPAVATAAAFTADDTFKVSAITQADVVRATEHIRRSNKDVPMTAPPIGSTAGVSRFAKLAKEFEAKHGLGQASSVLREVRAVPTIFPQLDQVLGVGGWPTDCFFLIHGESNGGKTEFSLGLILSFLVRDHAALLVDAERTTPISWVRKLMGGHADHPGFTAMYPKSYEQVVDAVRAWAENIGNAKAHGRLDPDTTGICVIDSLRKLTPKKMLDRLMKELAEGGGADEEGGGRKRGARGIDGAGGRAAQIKAALNAQWADELTPLLHDTGTCLGVIAREYEAATDLTNFFAEDFKVSGGKNIYFESSIVARIGNAGAVTDDAKQTISEKHYVQVRKTKVASKLTKYPRAHFHVASGLLEGVPYGFEGARDLLEIATQIGSVDQSGSQYYVDGENIGAGENRAVQRLTADPELRAKVELATRAAFMPTPESASPAPATINRRVKPAVKGKPKARKATKGKGKKR